MSNPGMTVQEFYEKLGQLIAADAALPFDMVWVYSDEHDQSWPVNRIYIRDGWVEIEGKN